MQLTSQEIKRLTDMWRQNALTAQGGVAIGPKSEQYRLHKNDIGFHELDYDELRTATVELTKLLLIPGRNTVVDLDHYLLWAWCAEVLIGRNGPLSTIDREIYTLAQTTTRAALAGANPPTREAFERAAKARNLLNHNADQFLTSNLIALSYLCFPLLEAIARRACVTFLDINGIVLQPFPRSGGGSYRVSKRCSNVGDVLRLLQSQVANNILRADLDELLNHVAGIANSADGCETVFTWRNSSLHGEATHQTIGGTIYTMSMLIALDGIRNDYIKFRNDAVARAQWVASTRRITDSHLSPWSFYPLF